MRDLDVLISGPFSFEADCSVNGVKRQEKKMIVVVRTRAEERVICKFAVVTLRGSATSG